MSDPTALSNWFPIVRDAGLPVPRTVIVDMPPEAVTAAFALFDGREDGDMSAFLAALREAGSEVGFPCFLRTDYTSGKHGWERTCFVAAPDDLAGHVSAIIEYSEMADFIGLPWQRWAVREFLPTQPVGVCPDFGNMPICKEFRFFVEEGRVRCWHPYWPGEALEQGGAVFADGESVESLSAPRDIETLTDMAEQAGRALGGAWSIDFLATERGWFLTDMAEAGKSFHWPECENHAAFAREAA